MSRPYSTSFAGPPCCVLHIQMVRVAITTDTWQYSGSKSRVSVLTLGLKQCDTVDLAR